MRFLSLVDSLVFSGVVISVQGRRRTGEEQGTGEGQGKKWAKKRGSLLANILKVQNV